MGGLEMQLDINKLPDSVFIKAVRCRQILIARMMTKDEKASIPRGSGDIVVRSPIGEEYILYRNDVLSNYRYLNGSRISIAGWERGRQYLIYKEDNTPVFICCVPSAKYSELINNNQRIKNKDNGIYLVCMQKENQEPYREKIYWVTSKLFKKMFKILPNDKIEKHYKKVTKYKDNFDFGDGAIDNLTQHEITKTTIVKQPEKIENNSLNETTVEYKYEAIARVVTLSGETVGFILSANNGQTKKVTKSQLMAVANKKLVRNIVLVSKDNKYFLRGNGITIESLPVVLN